MAVLVLAAAGAFGLRAALDERSGTVTVVHWTTGHLLRDGSNLRLLHQMADEFNHAGYNTTSGKKVRIEVDYLSGADQWPELVARVNTGLPATKKNLPNPTIVTPSASHWLVNVNKETGREVIDLKDTLSRSIARSYVGIVTYKEMAECLGWPNREIGYADIINLRNDPRGWSAYPCARAEWGSKPLIGFTDPSASDTGRAVLMTLYSTAAGKAPEDLTAADIANPTVIAEVKKFQSLVDHYMASTIPLNTKVNQGPRYGHFFIMPEDNLIHLYDGSEVIITDNGFAGLVPPLTRPMVMIYPKEGSLLRENCACVVKADWVSDEQREGGEMWFEFLREDKQQRSFMAAGFRPGTNLQVTEPISAKYGLSPAVPTKVVYPERMDPAVAQAIDASWEHVKRPGIVTLVVDISGSMEGNKLTQAKNGVGRFVEEMAQSNDLAFYTFSSDVTLRTPMGPLAENKFRISEVTQTLKASGGTALYDAIRQGIESSDRAPGPVDAIRAVVVLTDGKATGGTSRLSDLVTLSSRSEVSIPTCLGFQGSPMCTDVQGRPVQFEDMVGDSLKVKTTHPVQVFFIGLGDADMNVGRILSQATGAEFQGATEKDLAEVIKVFSKYF